MGAYRFFLGNPSVPNSAIEFKHVNTLSISCSRNTMTVGIPTRPPEESRIFPIMGPTLTFTLSGERFENEETTSNMNFIYGDNGLEDYVSRMQVTYPYKFQIAYDSSLIGGCDGSEIKTGIFYVSVTNFNTNLDSEQLGRLTYSISLMQRRGNDGTSNV